MKKIVPLLIVVSLAAQSTNAFEVGSHALLTYKAWQRLMVGKPDTLDQLGLVDKPDAFRTERYYDVQGMNIAERTAVPYERDIIAAVARNNLLSATASAHLSIAGWLMRGSIREDEPDAEQMPRGQDPYGDIHRVFNHFFDPINNAPLTVDTVSPCQVLYQTPCQTNVDWAIGTIDYRQIPMTPNAGRRNHFTVFDARESMYRALTGKTGDSSTVDSSPGNRNAYWATTFRALGDVAHLNQDMGQPQHTRNEVHSGKGPDLVQGALTGHSSVLESIVEASVLGQEVVTMVNGQRTDSSSVKAFTYDSYSTTPGFGAYADFWTRTGRQGLADYTNRGFFTPMRNLGSFVNPYPDPVQSPAAYTVKTEDALRWDGTPVPPSTPGGASPQLDYMTGSVPDTLTNAQEPDVRLTTRGAWDQFARAIGRAGDFTLTRANYLDMADRVLPRAVAYSSGLLQYFFRGRLKISLPDEGAYAVSDTSTGFGFKVLKLKVMNTTPNETMQGGKAIAVVKYHKNNCYQADLSGEYGSPGQSVEACRNGGRDDIIAQEEIVVATDSVDLTLAPGEEKPLTFSFIGANIPLGISDVSLQVVYRGKLGNEGDAVVVGTKNISEPTYFAYHNATDYIHLAGHVYTRDQVNNDPALLDLVFPQGCVDRTQSPPQLQPYCLLPFTISIDLGFADIASPAVQAFDMPEKRFLRFAFLTDLDLTKSSGRALKAAIAVSGTGMEKALVNQKTICYPQDPFSVSALQNQLSGSDMNYTYSTITAVRGIYGWYSTSCVINGDSSIPGEPDDRNQVMSALASTTPYTLTVNPAFLPPP